MEDMKKVLQEIVEKFNNKNDPRKEKIKDLSRTIVIKFTDDGTYHMKLENATVGDVQEGEVEGDIMVETTTALFHKILSKEEDALSAYITKKIKIKAKLMDKLLLADLLK